MTKQLLILSIAFALTACGTINTIPLDDAYIWPDKKSASTESVVPVSEEPEAPAKTESTPAPTIEVINQQDTTITVRIKK